MHWFWVSALILTSEVENKVDALGEGCGDPEGF